MTHAILDSFVKVFYPVKRSSHLCCTACDDEVSKNGMQHRKDQTGNTILADKFWTKRKSDRRADTICLTSCWDVCPKVKATVDRKVLESVLSPPLLVSI
eukprot:g65523.t1